MMYITQEHPNTRRILMRIRRKKRSTRIRILREITRRYNYYTIKQHHDDHHTIIIM